MRFDRRVPLRLAHLHWATRPGDEIEIALSARPPHGAPSRRDLLTGAGFLDIDGDDTQVRARRVLSLPDTVATGMQVLVCGLNPSIYAAEHGVGFARGSNRFWRAALAAGLVTVDRDPLHALDVHRVGMTDLVKRATVASSDLTVDEYREGARRVEQVVRWMQPRVIAFVGLEGWRAAIDPTAQPGRQPAPFGGRPAYVLPSTSGLNARTSLDDLVTHLRAALSCGTTA